MDEEVRADAVMPHAPSLRVVDAVDGMLALATDGAACIAWRRRLGAPLVRWLGGLAFPMPRQGRWRLDADDVVAPRVRQWLAGWLAGVATPEPRWAADIVMLLEAARRQAHGRALSVRLDVVANDGCRLFHVDRLRTRWICTYRGPGTQWLPEDAVERAGLGRGNNDPVRDWTRVGQFEPGWFAAMRGDLWPGAEGRGFVHRSPPALPGESRIVLAIDAG